MQDQETDPIATFDIVLPTLKSSVGIDRMHWKQAYQERWCASPLTNVKPTVEMLTDDVVLIKAIHDQAWHPAQESRSKKRSHHCWITFDRSYVIWWYGQKLQELVNVDDQLLYDISQECGMDIANDLTSFSSHLTPEAQLEQLKARANELGYRIHKKESKKPKNEDTSISFQIT